MACYCSALKNAKIDDSCDSFTVLSTKVSRVTRSNRKQLLTTIKSLLELVDEVVETKNLKKQLLLLKKAPQTSQESQISQLSQPQISQKSQTSQLSQPQTSQAENRVSKIFLFKGLEYSTQVLLENRSKRWESDPSLFWSSNQEYKPGNFENPQYKVLFACLNLDLEDAHSGILRRFYTLVCHRIRLKESERDSAEAIAKVLYDTYHNDSQRSMFNEFAGKIQDLLRAGSRYNNIASSLGIGSLFCLGQDIPRTV